MINIENPTLYIYWLYTQYKKIYNKVNNLMLQKSRKLARKYALFRISDTFRKI